MILDPDNNKAALRVDAYGRLMVVGSVPGGGGGGGGGGGSYVGAVATTGDLDTFVDAVKGSTAYVGASEAAYLLYQLTGDDPTVVADWQALQGTMVATGNPVYSVEILEGYPECTALVTVPSGNVCLVSVGGVPRPPLYYSPTPHVVSISDVPGTAAPTIVTFQMTSGSDATGWFSVIPGSRGNATLFAPAPTYAVLTAVYPAAGVNLAALPAATRIYVSELAGEVRRDPTGLAWITDAVLGPYTWAQLMAAYPNGGAGLAALPPGIKARVVDATYGWNFEVAPNPARTYWVTVKDQTIYYDYSVTTGTLSGVAQLMKSTGALPAGILRAGKSFSVRVEYGKVFAGVTDVVTGNSTTGLFAHTSAAVGGNQIRSMSSISPSTMKNAAQWTYHILTSATTVRQLGPTNASNWNGGSGQTTDIVTGTIPNADSASVFLNWIMLMAGTTDTPFTGCLEVMVHP